MCFPVAPDGLAAWSSPRGCPRSLARGSIADVSFMFSEELGTQILSHQDSLTDYCPHPPALRPRRTSAPTALSSLPCSPGQLCQLALLQLTAQTPASCLSLLWAPIGSAHDLSPG